MYLFYSPLIKLECRKIFSFIWIEIGVHWALLSAHSLPSRPVTSLQASSSPREQCPNPNLLLWMTDKLLVFSTRLLSVEINTLSCMKRAAFAITSQKCCLNTELPLESRIPVISKSPNKDLNRRASWPSQEGSWKWEMRLKRGKEATLPPSL